MLFWGCPVADIQKMGSFRKHGRCGCGLKEHLRTAPQAAENFFKLLLRRDTRISYYSNLKGR
jgi:hypothetical protein